LCGADGRGRFIGAAWACDSRVKISVEHSTVYRYDSLNAWFDAFTTEMSVISRFTVEMLRESPFDYVIIGESLSLPLLVPGIS